MLGDIELVDCGGVLVILSWWVVVVVWVLVILS